MKNKLVTIIFVVLFFGVSIKSNAQTNSNRQNEQSFTKFSINYLSNIIYAGRKDSLATPYITPTLSYYDKSGFYISAGASYLISSNAKRFDLFSLDLGYDFSINDHFSLATYANKSFYNNSSNSVKGDITGSIGADLKYETDLFNLFTGGEILFSSKKDIAINLGISHDFEWGEKDNNWSIAPSSLINFSTLGYYAGYTDRKLNKKGQIILPNLMSTKSLTTVDNPGITLMDIEFNLPISYDSKKWGAFLNGTLVIPKNPIYTTTTTTLTYTNGTQTSNSRNSTPSSEINLKNSFFCEIGIYFKL